MSKANVFVSKTWKRNKQIKSKLCSRIIVNGMMMAMSVLFAMIRKKACCLQSNQEKV